jgi:glycosyltransferase involved in cell wall biosynthesis
VTLAGRIDDRQLVEHYARCRAVFFAPWNEDYGFVTLEAFRSGKAVLTAADSGGPAELVDDGRTGLVAPQPTPSALAERLDALADRATAERMGTAAREVASSFTWPATVETLLRP